MSKQQDNLAFRFFPWRINYKFAAEIQFYFIAFCWDTRVLCQDAQELADGIKTWSDF